MNLFTARDGHRVDIFRVRSVPKFIRMLYRMGALGFALLASSAWASDVCQVPQEGAQITKVAKQDCETKAITAYEQPELSVSDLIMGPTPQMPGMPIKKALQPAFGLNDQIDCVYFPRPQGGHSLKFRCYRTDDKGAIFNDAGEVTPAHFVAPFAVNRSEKMKVKLEEVLFSDADLHQPIVNSDGRGESADILKVRVGHDTKRDRENHTTVAAGRLFWALGYPAEPAYIVRSVQCVNCPAKLGGIEEPQFASGAGKVSSFELPSIERKFPGKRITAGGEAAPGIMELLFNKNKLDQDRWTWQGLADRYADWSEARKDDFEGLVLATTLVQALHQSDGTQNELVCAEGAMDDKTRECAQPIAIVHDLGGSFGSRDQSYDGVGRGIVKDVSRELLRLVKVRLGLAPRGSFSAYARQSIFRSNSLDPKVCRDAGVCALDIAAGKLRSVSERGRAQFSGRLRKIADDRAKVRAIFQGARFDQVDPEQRLFLEAQGLSGSEIDDAILEQWTDEFTRKAHEILDADCSGSEQSMRRVNISAEHATQ